MNLFFIIYISVILYILVPIIKIIWHDKLDKDLLFLLSTNYILLFMLTYLYGNTLYLTTTILFNITLIIFAYLLVRKIKSITGFYNLLSIPYFIFVVYSFSYLITTI